MPCLLLFPIVNVKMLGKIYSFTFEQGTIQLEILTYVTAITPYINRAMGKGERRRQHTAA